jgi:hypothetical protein
MLRSQWAASAALVLLAGIPASGAIGQTETPFLSQTESKQPPGEGALCLLAIYSFMAEVGKRCAPDRSPALQEELRRSVTLLEEYVAANSDISPDEIAKFEAEQGGVGAPEAELCHGDSMQFFEDGIADSNPATVREETEQMVARPGPPTIGDCL